MRTRVKVTIMVIYSGLLPKSVLADEADIEQPVQPEAEGGYCAAFLRRIFVFKRFLLIAV